MGQTALRGKNAKQNGKNRNVFGLSLMSGNLDVWIVVTVASAEVACEEDVCM